MDISPKPSSKISPLVNDIIKSLKANGSNDFVKYDFMFILVITIMMENGFLPLENESDFVDVKRCVEEKQLSMWKTQTCVYEGLFAMPAYKTIKSRLIMSTLGETVLLNVISNNGRSAEAYSLCIPLSQYVGSPTSSGVTAIFSDLDKLSFIIKNNIITPVKSNILSCFGYSSPSIIGIPVEVLINILKYLHLTDIINVSKSCSKLKNMIDSDSVWSCLCKRDFKDNFKPVKCNWKQFYKDKYISKRNESIRQILCEPVTMHDLMDYADYVSHIDNPMWDEII